MSGRTIQNRLFDIAWIVFCISQLVTLTAWYALDGSSFKVTAYKGAFAVTCVLCAAVIIINLVRKVYPLKTFICYILFAAVSVVSWYFCRNTLMLVMALLFMAAYEISARRVITISMAITGAVIFVTCIMAELGLTENYVFNLASHRPRYGIGFSWATNGPTLLFFFMIQYIFLRKAKMKIWEYLVIEAVNVYMYIRTDTNLPFILMTAILIFFAVQGLFRNHWRALRHLKWLYYLAPLIICVLSICLYIVIDLRSKAWVYTWFDINNLLNNRLLYGRMGYMDNGITLFGQQIDWVGETITGMTGSYNYVDCSYLRILLDQGLIYTIFSVGVYTRLIVRAVKKTDYWLVFIALAVLFHSFTEPRLMDLTFNVIPMLAFLGIGEEPVLYEKGMLKKIFAAEENP